MLRRVLAALLLLVPLPALAEGSDFVRTVQTARLEGGDFTGSWGFEVNGRLSTLRDVRPVPGEPQDYRGLMHRAALYAAPTSWLSVGTEAGLRQLSLTEFEAAGFQPEVRVRPFDFGGLRPSAFAGARLRLSAPRPSALLAGLGADLVRGRTALLAHAGFETARPLGGEQVGGRYALAASLRATSRLTVAAEAWGSVFRDAQGVQADHHAGPTLRLSFGNAWVSANAGAGLRQRPFVTMVDYSFLTQLGWAL